MLNFFRLSILTNILAFLIPNLAYSITPITPHIKTVTIKDFHINKQFLALAGPLQKQNFGFEFAKNESKDIWITRYSVKLMSNGKPLDEKYLCHATLNDLRGPAIIASNSQGHLNISLPDKFAYKIAATDKEVFAVEGMIKNLSTEKVDFKADLIYEIEYYSDSDAKKLRLIPLQKIQTSISVDSQLAKPVVPGRSYTSNEHQGHNEHHGHQNHGAHQESWHWLVPPGRHTYRYRINDQLKLEKSTKVRFLSPHVHSYAESMKLVDNSNKTELWKTEFKHKNNNILKEFTRFKSENDSFIPLEKLGSYDLEVTYNNTTQKPIDAMGFLDIFIEEND